MPPPFTNAVSHRGRSITCGANCTIALKLTFSGITGLPQSRPEENDQSSVRINPLAPQSRACAMRVIIESRVPIQYIWKKVNGFAPMTSASALLPKELSPIAVPRAAVALAIASSPSGCTACTPVGEVTTGKEIGWPMKDVARSRSECKPATRGASPSSENALVLSL